MDNSTRNLVLFDLDGTLLEHFYSEDNLFLEAMNSVCSTFDLSMPYWHDCPHLTDEYVFHYLFENKLGRKAHSHEYSEMRKNFSDILMGRAAKHERYFRPVRGANELVNSILSSPHIDCSVVTGSWQHIAEKKFELMGWEGDLPKIFSSDLAPTKAEFLKAAIDHHGHHNYDKIIYIGDSLYDYKVSTDSQLEFIGLDAREQGHFPEHVETYKSFEPLDEWMVNLSKP